MSHVLRGCEYFECRNNQELDAQLSISSEEFTDIQHIFCMFLVNGKNCNTTKCSSAMVWEIHDKKTKVYIPKFQLGVVTNYQRRWDIIKETILM